MASEFPRLPKSREEVINHPDYYDAPEGVRRRMLELVDPEFGAMTQREQSRVIDQTTPPTFSPAELRDPNNHRAQAFLARARKYDPNLALAYDAVPPDWVRTIMREATINPETATLAAKRGATGGLAGMAQTVGAAAAATRIAIRPENIALWGRHPELAAIVGALHGADALATAVSNKMGIPMDDALGYIARQSFDEAGRLEKLAATFMPEDPSIAENVVAGLAGAPFGVAEAVLAVRAMGPAGLPALFALKRGIDPESLEFTGWMETSVGAAEGFITDKAFRFAGGAGTLRGLAGRSALAGYGLQAAHQSAEATIEARSPKLSLPDPRDPATREALITESLVIGGLTVGMGGGPVAARKQRRAEQHVAEANAWAVEQTINRIAALQALSPTGRNPSERLVDATLGAELRKALRTNGPGHSALGEQAAEQLTKRFMDAHREFRERDHIRAVAVDALSPGKGVDIDSLRQFPRPGEEYYPVRPVAERSLEFMVDRLAIPRFPPSPVAGGSGKRDTGYQLKPPPKGEYIHGDLAINTPKFHAMVEGRMRRRAKRIREDEAGKDPERFGMGPPGPARKLARNDGQPFWLGRMTVEQRIDMIEHYVPDPVDMAKWANWYKEVKVEFDAMTPGEPGFAKEAMFAWLIQQRNTGPKKAFHDMIAKLASNLFGEPIGRVGLSDLILDAQFPPHTRRLRPLRQGEGGKASVEIGEWIKLMDFLDSAYGKSTRSVMGSDPDGGSPYVVDVWSGRTAGALDKKRAVETLIGKKANKVFRGNKEATRLIRAYKKTDVSFTEPQYEWVAARGRELTREFNRREMLGRKDWTTEEVQAVEWAAAQRMWGVKPDHPTDIFRGMDAPRPIHGRPTVPSRIIERAIQQWPTNERTVARISEAYLMMSPNVLEATLPPAEVVAEFGQPRHRTYRELARAVQRLTFGRETNTLDAMGYWEGNYENSVVIRAPGATRAEVEGAAAALGKAGRQKAVAWFQVEPSGNQTYTIIPLRKGATVESVKTLIDDSGLLGASVIINPKAPREAREVHVWDSGYDIAPQLGKLMASVDMAGRPRMFRGIGEQLGAETRGEAQGKYIEAINRFADKQNRPDFAREFSDQQIRSVAEYARRRSGEPGFAEVAREFRDDITRGADPIAPVAGGSGRAKRLSQDQLREAKRIDTDFVIGRYLLLRDKPVPGHEVVPPERVPVLAALREKVKGKPRGGEIVAVGRVYETHPELASRLGFSARDMSAVFERGFVDRQTGEWKTSHGGMAETTQFWYEPVSGVRAARALRSSPVAGGAGKPPVNQIVIDTATAKRAKELTGLPVVVKDARPLWEHRRDIFSPAVQKVYDSVLGSEKGAKGLEVARRGKLDKTSVEAMATELRKRGWTPEDYMETFQGTVMPVEHQKLALRYIEAQQLLIDQAMRARDDALKRGSTSEVRAIEAQLPQLQDQLGRMFLTVQASRSEAARTLGSRGGRLLSDKLASRALRLASDGISVSESAARSLTAQLVKINSERRAGKITDGDARRQIIKAVNDVYRPRYMEMFLELRAMNLISGIGTIGRNMVGNTAAFASWYAENAMHATIDPFYGPLVRGTRALTGDHFFRAMHAPENLPARQRGEFMAANHGLYMGIKAGMKEAIRIWTLPKSENPTLGRWERFREAEFARMAEIRANKEALRLPSIPGAAGSLIRIPGRLSAMADAIFYQTYRHAVQHQLAWREAARDAAEGRAIERHLPKSQRSPDYWEGDARRRFAEDLARKAAEIDFATADQLWNRMGRPEPGQIHKLAYTEKDGSFMPREQALAAMAHQNALDYTFRLPLGPTGAKIDALRFSNFKLNKGRVSVSVPTGDMMRIIAPFFPTPVNIGKHVWHRAPVLNFMSPRNWADLRSGDRALFTQSIARQAVGYATFAGLYQLAREGFITGSAPDDPSVRQQAEDAGVVFDAIGVPGVGMFKYRGLSPATEIFSMAAELAALERKHGNVSMNEFERWVQAGMATTRTFLDQPFLKGVNDITEALEAGADGRVDRFSSLWQTIVTGSLIPRAVSNVARMTDPTRRARADSLGTRFAQDIPGARQQTQKFIDPLGRTWDSPFSAIEVLAPFRTSVPRSPVDKMLFEATTDDRAVINFPPVKHLGRQLEVPQYEEFKQRRGMVLLPILEALAGSEFTRLPPNIQRDEIQKIETQANNMVKGSLVPEWELEAMGVPRSEAAMDLMRRLVGVNPDGSPYRFSKTQPRGAFPADDPKGEISPHLRDFYVNRTRGDDDRRAFIEAFVNPETRPDLYKMVLQR
jgi:hypothetical protein